MTAPINWPELITDLIRAQLTLTSIAKEIGVSRTAVVAYHNYGTTPLHATGERLIEVWCATTHRERTNAPRIAANAAIDAVTTLTE